MAIGGVATTSLVGCVMALSPPALGQARAASNNQVNAHNYYGANPTGSYPNTAQGAGPLSTEPGSDITGPKQTAAPTASSYIRNPNGAASQSVPVANGTGAPLVSNDLVGAPQPIEQTGLPEENPQESPTALIWMVVGTVLLVGSVFGAIRMTQPGGHV